MNKARRRPDIPETAVITDTKSVSKKLTLFYICML